jgi:hypothetical protein
MRALLVVSLLSAASVASAEKSPSPYVEVTKGKPLGGVRCPDASPCVVEFDFTYMILANGWKSFYVADYGTPDAPLRKGTKDMTEVTARAKQAILSVLAAKKVTRASIDCIVASSIPELVGLGDTVAVTLPPSGTAKPLAAMTADQVNTMWMKAYAPLASSSSPAPLFDDALRNKMTAGTFSTPTLVHASSSASRETCRGDKCTPRMTTQAAVYALYSPESKNVYAIDASLDVPAKEFEKREAEAHKAALASIAATSKALGVKSVALHRRTMCETGLLPRDGWFSWKR